MQISRGNCGSNQRCEVCPIERLDDANARVWASEIVDASRRTLNSENVTPKLATVSTVIHTAEHYARELHRPELAGAAVGALAINMADKCRVD